MNPCLLHPEQPAAGGCEFCAGQYCGGCLQSFLGRRYCPSCLERVRAMAGLPSHRPTLPAVPSTPTGAPPAAAGKPAPATPGWISGLMYLVGFLLLYLIGNRLMLGLLLGAKLLAGQIRSPADLQGQGSLMEPGTLGTSVWGLLLGFSGWGLFFLILAYTALLAGRVEGRSLSQLGLDWSRRIGKEAVFGFGLAALLFVSLVGIGAARGAYSLRLAVSWEDGVLITVFGLLVLLPFAALEEISVRGYLLPAFSRSWGRWGGAAASSLVFVALHSLNPHLLKHPLGFLGLFLAGVYLASAYLITDSLWLPIFLHTGWNLLEGPIFGLPVSGIELPLGTTLFQTSVSGGDLWTGGRFGPEAGLLLCLLLGIHLAVLWALRPLLRRPELDRR